jgi:hypothetical protein
MSQLSRRLFSAGIAALGVSPSLGTPAMSQSAQPEVILTNGKFSTLDPSNPNPEAVAITGGRFSAVGAARTSCRRRARGRECSISEGGAPCPG